MTIKSLIALVVIISLVYLPLRTSHAASLNKSLNRSILTELKNDNIVCKSTLVDSFYTKSCDNVTYPTENVTLDDKNSKQFLCLGFYDRICRFCWLDSYLKNGKTLFPENPTIFDKEVEKFLPKSLEDPLKFCESWKNDYPPRYSKIAKFVKEFDEAMKKPSTCVRICTNWNGEFDPLCAVLASMDKISSQTGVKIEDSKEKTIQEEKLAKETNENGKETLASASGLINAEQSKAETSLKSTGSKKIETGSSGKAENLQKSSKVPSKNVPELKNQPETEAPILVPQNSPPVAEKKPEESKKSKLPIVEMAEKNLANKEKVKIDTEILKHAAVTNSKHSSDDPKAQADPGLDNNGQVDAPQESEKQQDNMNQDNEKISELPDEKVDVISDHTQEHFDEPIGGGGEPLDDADELEPPTLAPPNQDVDESPAIPPESQDIHPRMPGIRNDDDSHFFGYFSIIGVICIAGYVGYHNKQKILAMVVEGRRSRGGRGRRRPSTANYRKLDCTLEEAVTSQCNSNVTHVIY